MTIVETITFVCLYYIFVKYACIYLMMPCIWTGRNKEYCISLYFLVLYCTVLYSIVLYCKGKVTEISAIKEAKTILIE